MQPPSTPSGHGRASPQHGQSERDQPAGPRRRRDHVHPVDAGTQRQVAPVRRVPGEGRRERDGERQAKRGHAQRARAPRREKERQREQREPGDPDHTEVRARQHRREGGDRGRQRTIGHGLGPRHQIGRRGGEQDDEAQHSQSAEPPAGAVDHRRRVRQHHQLDDEAADERRQGQEADPADPRGDHELRAHGLLDLKGNAPSVRWPSRATTLQKTL